MITLFSDESRNLDLHEDIIIYNILTRIPSKDLHRFRCVCKQWYNILNDRVFISCCNRSNNSAYTQRGFIRCERDHPVGGNKEANTTYSLDFINIDNKKVKEIPIQLPQGDFGDFIRRYGAKVSIEHSLNGLLLLCYCSVIQDLYKYYVYNPVTGTSLQVGTDTKRFNCYLAYDPTLSKYKAVMLVSRQFVRTLAVRTVVDLDECDKQNGDDPWRYFDEPANLDFIYIDKPVILNHSLHWICRKWINSEYCAEILRLGVSKEIWSTIKLPVIDTRSLYDKCSHLLEMGGLLWFMHRRPNYKLQLWYLKKTEKLGNQSLKRKRNSKGLGINMDGKWVVRCNINLMTEISLQQMRSHGSVESLPLLKFYFYEWKCCPALYVADPNCKITFTFYNSKYTNSYICSFDIESKIWELVYVGRATEDLHYWQDRNTALLIQ